MKKALAVRRVPPAQAVTDPIALATHRRAIEAINWAMPAVNLDLMLKAMIDSAKGKPNQIAYWSRLTDW